MKIGINCLRISPDYKGGINTFTFGLLDGFAASGNDHEFVIFAGPHNLEMFSDYGKRPNFRIVEINENWVAGQHKLLWLARKIYNSLPWRWHIDDNYLTFPDLLRWLGRRFFLKLPWRIRYRIPLRPYNAWLAAPFAKLIDRHVDVVYVPYPPPPLFPYPAKPTIYSIHDLQHVHFPEFFSPEHRLERDAIMDACARHATLLQATSRQMKDEFLAHFAFLRAEQIPIIPEGVNLSAYQGSTAGDVKERHGLPDRFLFFPAQLWHHKNHITILKALARLRERGIVIPLVLTGARYEASQHLFDFIEEHGLSGQVFYLGLVPYEDVIALHRAARFLITASLYEAGSIPTLEAAASGTPILAGITPSQLEHSRDLEMQLFAPIDDAALADLLIKVWDDDKLIAEQVAHNNMAIQNFTWQKAAQKYLEAFESLLPRRER
jgi:glycosyltransferase involved in cell wall biosynthesis